MTEIEGSFQVHPFVAGPLANNVFLLADTETRQAALIDPGYDSEFILDRIQREGLTLTAILCTHGHFDHVAGVAFFKDQTDAPLYLHEGDVELATHAEEQAWMFGLECPNSPPPDVVWRGEETFPLGATTFTVRHTPGHSPGSVSLVTAGLVLVGDVLFQGSVGRTDLPGGNFATLLDSIHRVLFALPEETRVYCGHGPETTIGREKRFNPFCRRPGL